MLSLATRGGRAAVRAAPAYSNVTKYGHSRMRHISGMPANQAAVSASVDVSAMPPYNKPEIPVYNELNEYWRMLPPFKDVGSDDFLSWRWSTKLTGDGVQNVIEKKEKLYEFLRKVLPPEVPRRGYANGMQSREEFEGDIASGIRASTMSLRVMPYVLSRINWNDPANDPIFRQFIPLKSVMMPDHPMVNHDSLGERADSPVDGIVHRYPDKALFLPLSVCPTYCSFCTRAYGVGADTELVTKDSFKLARTRIEKSFAYIESQPRLHDIVISGGDAYYLPHHVLEEIGERLIKLKNIKRFRFASKGLAVSPSRFLENEDPWTAALIRVSNKAKMAGKQMALHTHFNHPNEISEVTERAAHKLLLSGVTVRNQSVLLRGVNDNVGTMGTLINKLADMSIQPYYVYQCDMVEKIEHLRTPLQTILDLESQLRGSVAGFYMPNFVVDLPGGGGKRLACSYESYDRESGVSTFTAPALTGIGKKDRVYTYHDPVRS
ncbi:Uu.00g014630.m01.CDS01 [Anthostomella pinea]|uniref:Uu.00g014630.m01.CDS01 n=1 Tax=Anthostomella pinea TaxID=933095 RepID=A0AAI8VYC6_9PEZI|nr:Uu.00g014630.m01.CDS01 [Anthostomella pinea]